LGLDFTATVFVVFARGLFGFAAALTGAGFALTLDFIDLDFNGLLGATAGRAETFPALPLEVLDANFLATFGEGFDDFIRVESCAPMMKCLS
jgi:hypothetical protein